MAATMDILAARKKAAERSKAQSVKTPDQSVQPEPAEQVPTGQAPAIEPAPQSGAEAMPVTPESDVPLVMTAPPAENPEEHAGPLATAFSTGPDTAGPGEVELLSFRIGGEGYAIMVEDVREVLRLFQLTRVPNAPEYVLGIMSLRGVMLPVFDLCKRLGIAPEVRDEKSRIIVVGTDDEDIGLMVDRVTGVIRILPDEIRPAPDSIDHEAEYVSGIARKDDKLYILLDLKKAVSV